MNNQFLRDFIKMRQNLVTTSAPVTKKSSKDLRSLPDTDNAVSLKSLIDDKPSDKVVKEYFKRRISELETEED